MATQFLQSDQETSDIINPGGITQSGAVLISLFGTMTADEKWQIEQAEASKDASARVWSAVHSTDFLTATTAPGGSGNMTVDRWAGPRQGNRVFEVPIGDGFVYRVRLVYKGGTQQNAQGNAISNSTVTACWAEAKTKTWL